MKIVGSGGILLDELLVPVGTPQIEAVLLHNLHFTLYRQMLEMVADQGLEHAERIVMKEPEKLAVRFHFSPFLQIASPMALHMDYDRNLHLRRDKSERPF